MSILLSEYQLGTIVSTDYADYADFVLKDRFGSHSKNLCNLRSLWTIPSRIAVPGRWLAGPV